MNRDRLYFFLLNIGHFLDHLFTLIFATVAALALYREWGVGYAQLLAYATPGFFAFGLFSLPAGWLADRWSRAGMMAVFFIGVGASAVLAGLAESPLQIAASLTLIGVFAAIYHPVGLAMVIEGRDQTGIPLAVNGVFGNLGVASAALITGFLIDSWSWRSAFMAPGFVSIAIGALYLLFNKLARGADGYREASMQAAKSIEPRPAVAANSLLRIFSVILFTTALGGLIFQSTTFALPKVLDERLPELASTATLVSRPPFLARPTHCPAWDDHTISREGGPASRQSRAKAYAYPSRKASVITARSTNASHGERPAREGSVCGRTSRRMPSDT